MRRRREVLHGVWVALLLVACPSGPGGPNGPFAKKCSWPDGSYIYVIADGGCPGMQGAVCGSGYAFDCNAPLICSNGQCGSPQAGSDAGPDGGPPDGGSPRPDGGPPDAGPCTEDVECTSGICVCGGYTNNDNGSFYNCFGGSCGPLAAGACARDEDCRSGICTCGTDYQAVSVYLENGNGQTIIAARCPPYWLGFYPPPTGVCGPVDAGPCGRDEDCSSGICAAGLLTLTDGGLEPEAGLCNPQPNGAQCHRAEDCLSGVCPANGYCGQAVGGPCTDGGDCQPLLNGQAACTPGQASACGPSATCPNGACQGLLCYQATCEYPQPNGSQCVAASECAAGLCLNGTCGPQPDGEPCTLNTDCAKGWCNTGTCQALLLDGVACSADYTCASNLCFNGHCQSFVATGGMCTSGLECTSSFCTGGICTCLSPGTETSTPTSACCSGTGTEYTDCNDPDGACSSETGASCTTSAQCCHGVLGCYAGTCFLNCTDSNGDDICCGTPTGNYNCNPSDGVACTVTAQCDTGLSCGGAGDCCALPGQQSTGCCSGVADGGVCECASRWKACQAGDECCSGGCLDGGCSCATTGAFCSGNSLCCSGVCNGGGVCACSTAGVACGGSGECCSGSCAGGTCACAAADAGCTQASDCCSGSCGASKQCQCAAEGQPCSTSDPQLCCSGVCNGGSCG